MKLWVNESRAACGSSSPIHQLEEVARCCTMLHVFSRQPGSKCDKHPFTSLYQGSSSNLKQSRWTIHECDMNPSVPTHSNTTYESSCTVRWSLPEAIICTMTLTLSHYPELALDKGETIQLTLLAKATDMLRWLCPCWVNLHWKSTTLNFAKSHPRCTAN